MPLSSDQLQALDALDDTLKREDLRVEFRLRPGDMLWVNNRWILHNRTAFEDDDARAPSAGTTSGSGCAGGTRESPAA